MRNLKKAVTICICIISIIGFCGCVEKKDNKDIGVVVQKPTELVYSIGDVSSDLLKLDEKSSSTKSFSKALFQGLVSENDDGSIDYTLAQKCEISPDGLVYKFTLRDNIKWSNGNEITSQDFYELFKDLLTLNYNSVYRNELKCIYGVTEYSKGTKNFSEVAITASQKNILEIRLNYQAPYFLHILSQPIYSLRKIDANLCDWKNKFKDIIYSGPYKITRVSESEKVTLEKNQYYISSEKVKSNKLILDLSKKSSEFVLADFETLNNIDSFLNPPVSEVDRLVMNKEATIESSFTIKSIFFNFRSNAATSDVNFRKAISLILIKNRVTDKSINYYGKENLSYFPSSSNFKLNKDIDKNSQGNEYELLKNSKYNSGDVIKVAYIENDTNKKLCESILKVINDKFKQNVDNKSNVSINFELDGYSSEQMESVIKSNSYDMYLGDYNINYNDPMAFLELWQSNSPYNWFGYNSLKYDSSIYLSNILNDKGKQDEMYSKCIEELNNDVVVIPIYTKSNIICYKTYIDGIKVDKYGSVLFDRVTIR